MVMTGEVLDLDDKNLEIVLDDIDPGCFQITCISAMFRGALDVVVAPKFRVVREEMTRNGWTDTGRDVNGSPSQ